MRAAFVWYSVLSLCLFDNKLAISLAGKKSKMQSGFPFQSFRGVTGVSQTDMRQLSIISTRWHSAHPSLDMTKETLPRLHYWKEGVRKNRERAEKAERRVKG
jgi:hypothetical protein